MNIKVQLLEFGMYDIQAKDLKKKGDSSSPKEYYYEASANHPAVLNTTKIPLMERVIFGIKFIIDETSGELNNNLKICLNHPEIESTETNFVFTQTVKWSNLEVAHVYFEFFIFEKRWEMQPGFWTYQVFYGPDLVLEKEFEVYIDKEVEAENEAFFYDL